MLGGTAPLASQLSKEVEVQPPRQGAGPVGTSGSGVRDAQRRGGEAGRQLKREAGNAVVTAKKKLEEAGATVELK